MKLRENVAVKALAFTAAVAAFTATAIMGWYQLANFDALWESSANGRSYTRRYLVQKDYWAVETLVDLKEKEASGQELSLSQRRSLEQMEASLDPGVTNLRWQLLGQDGKVIYGNTREDYTQKALDYWVEYSRNQWRDGYTTDSDWIYWSENSYTGAANWRDFDGACCNDAWRELLPELVEQARENPGQEKYEYYIDTESNSLSVSLDTVLCDDDTYTPILTVNTLEGSRYVYFPTIRACLEPNLFGFVFDPDTLLWEYDADFAPTGETAGGLETVLKPQSPPERANLVLWVDENLPVNDQYRAAAMQLRHWRTERESYLAMTIVLGVAGVLLMVYLCCGAGHKKGVEGVYLNWFHRLPGDVMLGLMFLGGVAAVGIGVEETRDMYMGVPMYVQLICVGLAVAAAAALGQGALITICARCKAHTIFRDTWIWKLCGWLWKLFVICFGKTMDLCGACVRAVQAVPLIWKAVVGCMAYALFTLVTAYYGTGLWLIVTAVAAFYLCWWAYQWKKIRQGTQEIIGGNPGYQIDTRYMFPDLKGHADELNNLGHAISAAVEDRLKSEHFKAELITNVSHDLKTPLTSIINYVDLLKKVDIDNPAAQEYIEVLDRKSQRLKKLTEDLVEASKASTGNLTVNWERIDWAQLTDQALAETGDRLEAQKLTVVRSLPEGPLWVEADGRHLWRVLDNLLSNCAKYALPGTRVYVDLRRSGDWAVLSVKNISREPLDIPAEQLMERFVRGDESRNLEGSGLGLSIAQSLTELQHGRFEISIDGDLFKAIVTLPLAGGDRPGPLPGGRPDDPIQLVL